MNVTLGIPRLKEILMTASKQLKTPSMDIPFVAGITPRKAEKLRLKLIRVTVADVLESKFHSFDFISSIANLNFTFSHCFQRLKWKRSFRLVLDAFESVYWNSGFSITICIKTNFALNRYTFAVMWRKNSSSPCSRQSKNHRTQNRTCTYIYLSTGTQKCVTFSFNFPLQSQKQKSCECQQRDRGWWWRRRRRWRRW